MRFYFCILFGLLISSLNAQNYLDLAKFSYGITNSNKFLNSTEKTNIEEFKLQLNFPVVLDQKNTLLMGLNSKKFQLRLDPENSDNFKFYFIGLELGINQVYSEKWRATYFLFPGIASDLNTISKRDIQIGILALFNYTKRKNLRYKFGLYGHTELYGPLIVPLLGLYYTSTNQQWEFDLNLPIMVEINHKLSNRLTIGTNFDGLGSTYNFNKSFSISENPYLAKTSNELFAFSRFQLDKSIFLKISAGYSFFRKFKVYDKNDKVDLSLASIYFGDDRTPLNTRFKDGAIFKLELIYRVYFD